MDINECYSKIATDFSNTRFSIWKKVKDFLDSIPDGSLVGDIGCGNGKNMLYKKDILKYIGLDYCSKFVDICIDKGLHVVKGDILELPFESNFFDSIICIAVIHHLNTRYSRIKAISELLRVCKYGGCILIYVWSINMYDKTEKREFVTKDEMVPYITKSGEVYYRYYHLYDTAELYDEIIEAGKLLNLTITSFTDKNNECVIITKNF